ncbi:hypothetical protein P12x_002418 [Tundrisphaera lichenicola]|uniref:hypothetical protein n=1 Tax=Tundrisphaera lichenicola TaxID=2029860 RepID=UPI003EBA69BE
MERDERCAVPSRIIEDRLSASLAAIVLAANLFGGGLLALFKVLDVPPMVSGTSRAIETSTASVLPPGLVREEAPRLARIGADLEVR